MRARPRAERGGARRAWRRRWRSWRGACVRAMPTVTGSPRRSRARAAKAGGDLQRCAGDSLHSADVEEGFVDREPLDGRGGVLEERVEGPARLRVRGHSRADDDRVRAEPSGLASAHRRPDAVRLCLVAGGEHDAAADDHRTIRAGRGRRAARQTRRTSRHRHAGSSLRSSWTRCLQIERMFALMGSVQLALDGLDRLVASLEEHGSLPAMEAARLLFASRSIPAGLASSLLAEVCAGDSRIVCTAATVSLAGAPDPLLEEAEFVVFDLETTGLSAQTCRICELGAVRVRALELVDCFQSLVDPGVPLPQPVARLTGLREQRAARRSARRDSRRPLPVLRRRRAARRAQRPLRPAFPRAAAAAGERAAGWRSRRCVRQRSPAACSTAACGGSASPHSPISSGCRPLPVTARYPTRRRRPRSSST